MKVIVSLEQQELLSSGNKIIDKHGNTWYYLPYWFKKPKNGHIEHFELFSSDGLPEEFREQLKKLRE